MQAHSPDPAPLACRQAKPRIARKPFKKDLDGMYMCAQRQYARLVASFVKRLVSWQERGRSFGMQALADGGRERKMSHEMPSRRYCCRTCHAVTWIITIHDADADCFFSLEELQSIFATAVSRIELPLQKSRAFVLSRRLVSGFVLSCAMHGLCIFKTYSASSFPVHFGFYSASSLPTTNSHLI